MVDFYHAHGWGPLKKYHFAGVIFAAQGSENQPYPLQCPRCEKEVPGEVVTAVRLLVDI
jgi:hypothetical protein